MVPATMPAPRVSKNLLREKDIKAFLPGIGLSREYKTPSATAAPKAKYGITAVERAEREERVCVAMQWQLECPYAILGSRLTQQNKNPSDSNLVLIPFK